jgi:HAE1 family hydrophobic/amphiphilic exporter-1
VRGRGSVALGGRRPRTGAFVTLAATGRALDLSAIIGLLMLRGITVTNAIVLLDVVQHNIEAGADVRTVLIQGGRAHVRPIPMTATATITALIPLALSTNSTYRNGSHGGSASRQL